MVVIDASILMLFLRPDAGVPVGPENLPVDSPLERIAYLVQRLEKARDKIIIPAPALSEVLVRADPLHAQRLVERLSALSVFRIEAFDERAAIEVAIMTRNSADKGLKPSRRDNQSTYAKLKYDRQIVAIALVAGASAIYSDDGDIRAIAKRANVPVIGLADLELPPEDAQQQFPFDEAKSSDVQDDEMDQPGSI
jgi:predicted nucleic acid-binding protein